MTDANGLGGVQGPSSVTGLPTRCAGAQDLVKSRTHVEAVNFPEIQPPLLFRLRLGRLEIA